MTSRNIGCVAFGLGAFVLASAVGFLTYTSSPEDAIQIQDNSSELEEDAASKKQAEEKGLSMKNGKIIANRLEEECDYWGIDKYNQDGTITISKSFYSQWGGKQVLMLPRSSWNSLSEKEREDLVLYVSEIRGVTSIIVGNVVPSEKYNGNTITVDDTVWPTGDS